MDHNFLSEDREILRDLYTASGWVEVYFFHKKYLLSPAQITRTIRKLEELKIVEVSDYKIRMTEFGRKWLLANRRQVFLRPDDMSWKNTSSKVAYNDDENSTYFPRPGKMRQPFYEKLYGKVKETNNGA